MTFLLSVHLKKYKVKNLPFYRAGSFSFSLNFFDLVKCGLSSIWDYRETYRSFPRGYRSLPIGYRSIQQSYRSLHKSYHHFGILDLYMACHLMQTNTRSKPQMDWNGLIYKFFFYDSATHSSICSMKRAIASLSDMLGTLDSSTSGLAFISANGFCKMKMLFSCAALRNKDAGS